jgi:hypothetical protein
MGRLDLLLRMHDLVACTIIDRLYKKYITSSLRSVDDSTRPYCHLYQSLPVEFRISYLGMVDLVHE